MCIECENNIKEGQIGISALFHGGVPDFLIMAFFCESVVFTEICILFFMPNFYIHQHK